MVTAHHLGTCQEWAPASVTKEDVPEKLGLGCAHPGDLPRPPACNQGQWWAPGGQEPGDTQPACVKCHLGHLSTTGSGWQRGWRPLPVETGPLRCPSTRSW